MRRIAVPTAAFFFVLMLAGAGLAQQAAAPAPSPAPALDIAKVQEFVAREFGPGYKIVPGQPPLILDLDGDRKPDLVVVAKGPDPFQEQPKYHYKVADPYDEYFGYGNAKVTIEFGGLDPSRLRYLLIAQDWENTPKNKAILINVPEFQQLKVGAFAVKKKIIQAVTGSEGYGGVEWAIYWNGKKYQWEAYGLTPEKQGNSPDKEPW